MGDRLRQASKYLRKHQLFPSWVDAPPDADLGITVVIPCHDEPDLGSTLTSLWQCARPRKAVEVLVIVNASESDEEAIRLRNRKTVDGVMQWSVEHEESRFRCHVVDFPHLPARHAGVGLARKIGMDEAVARFVSAEYPNGIIASLDADCRCDENYLTALEDHFLDHPHTRACTIYFEHALDDESTSELRGAITRYELFLRYYRHGLRYAGFPFDQYTVGSCMAVRCDHYARHGGMNRRKAGEDFYFLNKLMAVGGVTELTATRVSPGVRASTRTPFGTGRALASQLAANSRGWQAYAPAVFRDLSTLVGHVGALYEPAENASESTAGLAESVVSFLGELDFTEKLAEIRRNVATRGSFEKRFFQWFDGFRALKYIHHATRHYYPREPLEQACTSLLLWQDRRRDLTESPSAEELLLFLRRRDRCGSHGSTVDKGPAGVRLTAG